MQATKQLSLIFLALLVWLGSSQSVQARPQAHPADEGRQEVVFGLRGGQLQWVHEFWLGPLVGLPTWAQIDRDGNGLVDDSERQSFAQSLQSQVELQIDEAVIVPHLISIDIAPESHFVAQPATPQIRLVFSNTITAGTHSLRFQTRFNPQRIKFMARFPSGGGVAISNAQIKGAVFAAQMAIKPAALLSNATTSAPTRTNETSTAPAGALSSAISNLIEGNAIMTPGLLLFGLLAAFGVGAAHTLTPGHGKGMIGDRGGWLHALILALIMTGTHTSSVIIVGVLALLLTHGATRLSPTVVVPWLTLLSGLLMVIVGAVLVWQRSRILAKPAALPTNAGAHDENQPHIHQRLTMKNLPRDNTGRISWRALTMLGISGGLLPCADALAILLLAISVNHVVLGLVLLLAFSLGIGVTLTMLGTLAAGGQHMLRRYNRLQPMLAWLPLASALVVLVLGVLLLGQTIL